MRAAASPSRTAVSSVSSDAQLRVAVLLDHEDRSRARQESLDVVAERESRDAHVVHADLLPCEHVERLAHRAVAAADASRCRSRCPRVASMTGARHVASRAVAHLRSSRSSTSWYSAGVLGVGAVLVVARAAREVGALGVHARQVRYGDAVAVPVDVAVELLAVSRAPPARQHLAAVGPVGVVPLQVRGTSSRSCRCPDPTARTPASAGARRDRTPAPPCRSTPPGSPGTGSTCRVSPCEA